MKSYFSAKVLDNLATVPQTSKRAMPTATVNVRNAKVIVVKDVMYRNATFDGTFLLGDNNDLPLPKKGVHSVEVYCCWFGHRLKTSGLNFKIDMSTAKVKNKYTGKVSSNLSIPEAKKEIEEESTQSLGFEGDNINMENVVLSNQAVLKNEPVYFSSILYASILILLISAFITNAVPRDMFEWANFLGKTIGVVTFLYVVNFFLKLYGIIIALVFYSIFFHIY